jgi:hypothetical protein
MGDDGAPDRHPDPPPSVEITIVAGARARSAWMLRRAHAPALAVLGAAIGALVALGTGAAPHARVGGRDPGPVGVAAACGYPPRCLTITMLAGDPTYARADFNRGAACGRFDGYVTAIFVYRDGRAWRPALEATTYSCPVASLPRLVQAKLSVCPT